MAPTAPIVNHLSFAYDNLLIFESSVEGANVVSNLLNTYCAASGKEVNHEKSSLFFCSGFPQTLLHKVKDSLEV